MNSQPQQRIKVTYLYHSADKSTFDDLYRHLAVLRKANLVEERYESLAGANFQQQTQDHLKWAQVIILVVSSYFNSDDILSGKETTDLLEECWQAGVCVWAIIARSTYLGLSSFQKYGIFWGKDKAISQYNPQEEALSEITARIHEEIKLMRAEALMCEGKEFSRRNRIEEAISVYEDSLHHEPSYLPALLELGKLYRKSGQPEEAKKYFAKIISNNTKFQQKRRNSSYSSMQKVDLINACSKGFALLELKQFDKALTIFQETYQQALTDNKQQDFYARAYCGEGDTYMQMGIQASPPNTASYYNQALISYEKARACNFASHEYLSKIGETYLALARSTQSASCYEQAFQAFDQATHLSPDYALPYIGKGDVYSDLQHFAKALIAYEKALQLDHFLIHAHGRRGETLLTLNRPKEALSAFGNALSLEDNNAHYYYYKGRAYAKLERYQEALSAYNQARDFGLKSTHLFVYMAITLHELGDVALMYGSQKLAHSYFDDAIAAYNCGNNVEWHEKDIIHYGLGRIAAACGDLNKAIRHFQYANHIAPQKPTSYLEIGKVLIEQDNVDQAFDYFEKADQCCKTSDNKLELANAQTIFGDAFFQIAEKRHPEDYYAGLEKRRSKDYYMDLEKARDHYQIATRTDSRFKTWLGLGKTNKALHDYQEAIEALNQAIKLAPNYAECYVIKGDCCAKLARHEEASSLYQKAISLGYNKTSVYNALGDTYLAMKRYRGALKIFDHVLQQENNALSHCGRGVALREIGLNNNALEAFDAAKSANLKACTIPRYRHIIEDIRSLIEGDLISDPYNAYIHKQKGDVLLLLEENLEYAINAYNKALEYGHASSDIFAHRGDAYYKQQKYRNALMDYKKAQELDASNQRAQRGEKLAQASLTQYSESFFQKLVFWRAH
jgi:tetratricopeptide (TPR) repeat protein